MPPGVFVFLYGVGSILGYPIFIFWLIMGVRRWRLARSFRDRYFLLCLESALISSGLAVSYTTRTVVGLTYGFSTAIVHGASGVILALGLTLLASGMVLMVFVADLDTHPPKWYWTKYAIVATIVWAATIAWLSYHSDLEIPMQVPTNQIAK